MPTSKSAAKRQRRTYSEVERAVILRDAEEFGVVQAAAKHQVPKTTISGWRSDARGVAASEEKRAKGVSQPRGRARATKTMGARISEGVRARAVSRAGSERGQAASAEGPGRSRASARASATKDAGETVSPVALRSSKVTKPGSNRTPGAGAGEERGGSKRKVVRRYTPSQRAEAVEYAAAHGVSAASAELGMSRFALYQWQRRVAAAAGGEGESPTGGPDPAEVEARRDEEILGQWRRHPGLGPSQIRNQLRREGIKVSVATVRRVMEDAGYRPPKVKQEPHDERFEAVRPNHLWHVDFVQRYINRAKTFTLIFIDDYSRFVVGHGVDDAERSELVLRRFEEAVKRHGKPERLMHDKGSAFWSWRGIAKFTALLTEMGIDSVVAEHKEHNGKIEVFNGNLHKELFNVQRFSDVGEMRQRLASHLHWYNHERTHHSLGGLLVPADRYYGRVEEVLQRIESGALREGDDLGLRQRGLEFFKIVSKGGKPELWLLGQRLPWPIST